MPAITQNIWGITHTRLLGDICSVSLRICVCRDVGIHTCALEKGPALELSRTVQHWTRKSQHFNGPHSTQRLHQHHHGHQQQRRHLSPGARGLHQDLVMPGAATTTTWSIFAALSCKYMSLDCTTTNPPPPKKRQDKWLTKSVENKDDWNCSDKLKCDFSEETLT